MPYRLITAAGVVLLIAFAMMGCMGCSRIAAGNVGIVVNMAGNQRGVEDFPVTTGWVFYNPMTQQVFEYPCFVQTAAWVKEEAINFGSKDGMMIGADINLSYQLDCQKAPSFYVTFRSDNLDDFTHGFMHNVARDVFNNTGAQYQIEQIYGEKKKEFVEQVQAGIQEKVKPYGVIVNQFGFMGALRIPDGVMAALNAKVQATQDAMRVENELRQIQADAQKTIAKAEGERQAAIKTADGVKQAAILEAEGTAEANRKIAASLSPAVLEWQRIQVMKQWDGSVPAVQTGSGSGTFFQMPLPGTKRNGG